MFRLGTAVMVVVSGDAPSGRSPGATEAGWRPYKDAGGRPAAQSRCPPPHQGMHLKNQPARQLSDSTFYLQRGFQGSACVPSPGVCLPCRRAGDSGPGSGGALCLQPQREPAAQGVPGLPLWPGKRLQEAAGRGRRPRQQARGAALRPLIAPGRSVGAAASRASPAPSRCWRWARGSRRRGGTALVPPPGRDGPRCWRGSPGWTGRCSARRRTLRRGEGRRHAARYRGAPRCSPRVPRGAGGSPGPASIPRAAPGRVGLTVGHLGAVDGVEAAASRRPNGAATVGLQDSEGRVPALPPRPGASGTLPGKGKGHKGLRGGSEAAAPQPCCWRWAARPHLAHLAQPCPCKAALGGQRRGAGTPGLGRLQGPLGQRYRPPAPPESSRVCSAENLGRGLF